jgi:hypothetical protein
VFGATSLRGRSHPAATSLPSIDPLNRASVVSLRIHSVAQALGEGLNTYCREQAGNEVSDDVDFSFGYRDEIPHIYASITQDHGKIDVLLRLVQDRTEHVNVNGKNEIVGQENFGMQHQSTSFGVELLDRQGKRLSVTTAHPNGIATFTVSRFPNAHPFSIRFCPASDIRPAQVKVPPSDAGFSYVDEKNI